MEREKGQRWVIDASTQQRVPNSSVEKVTTWSKNGSSEVETAEGDV